MANINTLISLITKKCAAFGLRKFMQCFGYGINIDDMLAKISHKPISLGFQVTNICNAKCIFCGYQYLNRPRTILSMDLFKKAIDEFDAFGGGGVSFSAMVGDPLMGPNLIERIKYARSKKNISAIGFFTNGILINKIGAREILTSGVNGITISIPGFDAQTYSRIFRTNSWNDVYEGMFNLLRENTLSGNKVDICIGLRSDIPIWRLLRTPVYQKLKKFRFELQYNIHYDNWSGLIKQEDLKGLMRLRRPPNKKKEPCAILYFGPLIMSNGDVTLCGCRDLNGDSELVIGNIKDRPILEMWRDPRVKSVRKGFYLSRYPKICQDCSFYNDLSGFRKLKITNLLKINRPS